VFALQFTDVASALSNFTTAEPYLNVTFRLDHRGHIAAVNAAIVSDIIPAPVGDSDESESGGVAGALKGLFGSKKDKDAEGQGEATVEGEEEVGDGESDKKDKGKGGKESAKKDKKEKGKKKEVKREKMVVRFKETYLGQRPMNGEEKRSTAAR
jgi:hypoxia up-regulated 1